MNIKELPMARHTRMHVHAHTHAPMHGDMWDPGLMARVQAVHKGGGGQCTSKAKVKQSTVVLPKQQWDQDCVYEAGTGRDDGKRASTSY